MLPAILMLIWFQISFHYNFIMFSRMVECHVYMLHTHMRTVEKIHNILRNSFRNILRPTFFQKTRPIYRLGCCGVLSHRNLKRIHHKCQLDLNERANLFCKEVMIPVGIQQFCITQVSPRNLNPFAMQIGFRISKGSQLLNLRLSTL